MALGHFKSSRAIAYCSSRPIHSMMKNIARGSIKDALRYSVLGMCQKRDLENIFLMNRNADARLSDLKNIHAKTVNANVATIERNSLREGNTLPCATISRWFLCVFKSTEGTTYSAFNNPQKIKVQLAPCQNPLTRNIIKTFLIFFPVLTLLPPRGMYK